MKVKELSLQYKITNIEMPDKPCNCSESVAKIFRDFQDCTREKLAVLHLNSKNKLLGFEIISIGGVTECIVSIPEVFKSALLHNAISIILIHNHPSGDPFPSTADTNITKKIKHAAETLTINLLDHVIIGYDSHFSYADNGMI